VSFAAARAFVYRDARLLERRLFETLFEGAPGDGVIDALKGYQNPDGGFGHALEPDKRAPDSQPLDVQIALETFYTAREVEPEMIRRACDFLLAVADDRGAVPIVLPSIADYDRAAHWRDREFLPELSPAVAIAGYLYKLDVDHPWRERAAAYCWSELEGEPPDDAHALRDALLFLEHAPDQDRAEALIAKLVAALPRARWFRVDPNDPDYGLTPLHFAPTPDSRCRGAFSDEEIGGHLDRLKADQEADGGWPLSWEPPSQAAVLEWRGYETVRAVRVLTAYGALPIERV
jgi:hypothetical protein